MTEVRMALPQEEAQLLDFINLVFSQVRVPHDFEALLPKVYAHPGFGPLHAVAMEEGRVRAAIALLPETLRVNAEHTLKAGYIGSVATHPKARGQGYMKRLMTLLIDRARQENMDFLALGGQRQRYGHYGFENGCAQASFTVTAKNVRLGLAEVEPLEVREITDPADALLEDVHRLGQGQNLTCLRDRDRLLEILHSYYGQLFALLDQGRLAGYLYAQGDDVQELALLQEEDADAAVKAWMADRSRACFTVPLCSRSRMATLQRYAESLRIEDSQMLLILNWQRVLEACFALACEARPMMDGEIRVAIEGAGAYHISVRDRYCEIKKTEESADLSLSRLEATALFFSASSFMLCDHPLLRDWLPLPLTVPVPDQF